MPPVLFFVLSYPLTQLAHVIFPAAIANGIISGAFVFCKYLPLGHILVANDMPLRCTL